MNLSESYKKRLVELAGVSIQNKKLTVVYQRVSEFGDRRDLFRAFTEKLSTSKIPYTQVNDAINFRLDESAFLNFDAQFKILKDQDNSYGNYTLFVEYISDSPHKDVVERFESNFDKIVFSEDADYEEYEQPYSANREYWIKSIS